MTKTTFCAAILCLALAPLAYAKRDKALVLPDACGDDKTEFKVNLVDDRPELKAQKGKALLVIVEEGLGRRDMIINRYGLDGSWVGATNGSSYFLVQVAPGEHHLCAAPQKHLGFNEPIRERMVTMTTFTAEAGKVYFFGDKEGVVGMAGGTAYVPPSMGSSGMGQYVDTSGSAMVTANYGFLTDDEGKYRVKAGKLATWTNK